MAAFLSAFLLSSLLLVGCVTKEVKVNDLSDFRTEKQKEFDSAGKPPINAVLTGIASGDLITSAIAGTYAKTLALKLKQDERLRNSSVATRLEDIRIKEGVEAEQKAIKNLKPKEQVEYAVFLKNSVDELSVVLEYSMEADKMAAGILAFNVSEYSESLLIIFLALEAISVAVEQLVYTQLALSLMIEDSNRYEESITLLGK